MSTEKILSELNNIKNSVFLITNNIKVEKYNKYINESINNIKKELLN